MKTAPVKCPRCSEEATPSITRFGVRHDHCGLWSWNGAPLVDQATHDARKVAHAAFDSLWKQDGMSRSKAYQLLAVVMELRSCDCHIKLFDVDTANRVPDAVAHIRRI